MSSAINAGQLLGLSDTQRLGKALDQHVSPLPPGRAWMAGYLPIPGVRERHFRCEPDRAGSALLRGPVTGHR